MAHNLRNFILPCLVLTGCVTTSFDQTRYQTNDRHKLLVEITTRWLMPLNERVYADQAETLGLQGVDWREVAKFQTGCQSGYVDKNASYEDLLVMHYLWVQNDGVSPTTKQQVEGSLGADALKSGLDVVAGFTVDCTFETGRFIDSQKS